MLNKDTLIGYSSFIWWCTWEYPIEVRIMKPEDLESGYESKYLRCFNYCRECGWTRVDNQWVSPDESLKFKTIYEAYQSQKYHDMVTNKDK